MTDISSDAYERILDQSGQFGFYQKRTYFLICALQAICVSLMAYTVYACEGQEPCPIQPEHLEVTTNPPTDNFHLSIYVVYDSNVSSLNYTTKSDSAPTSINRDLYNVRCQDVMSTDNGLTVILIALVLGALIGGIMADTLGRRPIMFIAMGLALSFQITMVTVETCLVYATLRALCGIFSGCFLVISIVLPLEVIGRRWRDFCVCLWVWMLGLPVLSIESIIVGGWRNTALTSGIVGLPFLGFYFLVPESARWLTCTQKFAKAESSIKEMISCNTRAVPDVLELCDDTRLYVMSTSHPRRHTYLDLFHTSTVGRWTVAVLYTWSVGCFVYCNLLNQVDSLTGNQHLDMILPFLLDLPICLSAVIINKCIGRRWCMFLYAVSSGFSMFCVLILHMMGDLHRYPYMITALAAFSKMGIGAALALLTLITAESFPTVVRCMAMAFGVSAGILGSLLSFYIRRYLTFDSYHYTIPYILQGLLICTMGVVGFALPETATIPMPDVLQCRHRKYQLQADAASQYIFLRDQS